MSTLDAVGKQLKLFHHLVSIHLIRSPVVWLLQQHQQHKILLNSSKKVKVFSQHDVSQLSGLQRTAALSWLLWEHFTFLFWKEVCLCCLQAFWLCVYKHQQSRYVSWHWEVVYCMFPGRFLDCIGISELCLAGCVARPVMLWFYDRWISFPKFSDTCTSTYTVQWFCTCTDTIHTDTVCTYKAKYTHLIVIRIIANQLQISITLTVSYM